MCTATFIEQFETLKAENVRLSERVEELEARLAQAEGLLEVCDLAYIKGGPYPVWKIHAFLHPEQEKNT